MGITLNGTNGVTTPGVVNSAGETIATTLAVTGATTMGSTLAVTGAATVGGNLTATGYVRSSGVTTNIYPIVLGTVNTSSSVTSKAFTGIPSWVTRITMTFVNVTPTATNTIIQIGSASGSYKTTGYTSVGQVVYSASGGTTTSTEGFAIYTSNGYVASGQATLVRQTGDVWTCTHMLTYNDGGIGLGAGDVNLGADLDRIRLYSETGTPTFSGNVNIMYE